ncbi:hypothetical protein Esti_003625 [Eimeria stiedai]
MQQQQQQQQQEQQHGEADLLGFAAQGDTAPSPENAAVVRVADAAAAGAATGVVAAAAAAPFASSAAGPWQQQQEQQEQQEQQQQTQSQSPVAAFNLATSESSTEPSIQRKTLNACKVELHPLHPLFTSQNSSSNNNKSSSSSSRKVEGVRRRLRGEAETAGHAPSPPEQQQQQLNSSRSRTTRSLAAPSLSRSSSSCWCLDPPGASNPRVKRWRLCVYQRVFLIMPSPSLWLPPSPCARPSLIPCLFIHRETAEMQQQLLPLQGFLLDLFNARPAAAAAAAAADAAKHGAADAPPPSSAQPLSLPSPSSSSVTPARPAAAAAAAANAAAAAAPVHAFGSFHLLLEVEALLGTLDVGGWRYFVVVLEAEPVVAIHEEEALPAHSLQHRLQRQQRQRQQHKQLVKKVVKLATRVVCLPYRLKSAEIPRLSTEAAFQQQQLQQLQQQQLQQQQGGTVPTVSSFGIAEASQDFLDDDRDLLGFGPYDSAAAPPQQQQQQQLQHLQQQQQRQQVQVTEEDSLSSAILKTWGDFLAGASLSAAASSPWGKTSSSSSRGGGVASWVQQQAHLLLGPNPLSLLMANDSSSSSSSSDACGGVALSHSGASPLEHSSSSGSGVGTTAAAAAATAASAATASLGGLLPDLGGPSDLGASAADATGAPGSRMQQQRATAAAAAAAAAAAVTEPTAAEITDAEANRFAAAVEKLLSVGFYLSYDLELSHSLQRQHELKLPRCRQALPGFPDARWRFDTQQQRDEVLFREATWRGFAYTAVADARFFWNHSLLAEWRKANLDPRWNVPLVQGYVGYARMERLGLRGPPGGPSNVLGVELLLLCRRSCRRGGTRYNARGIDDDGNVANFAESEQRVRLLQLEVQPPQRGVASDQVHWEEGPKKEAFLHHCPSWGSTSASAYTVDAAAAAGPATGTAATGATATADMLLPKNGCCLGHWVALLQARGSVPLFWGQSGITAQTAVNRNALLTANAFERHFHMLQRRYGPTVIFVNLLSTSRDNEKRLTALLEEQLQLYAADHQTDAAPPLLLGYDFHLQTRSKAYEAALVDFVQESLLPLASVIGCFCGPCDAAGGAAVGRMQQGVIRTNCLDCLDRTNVFQWYYSWFWLTQLLRECRYDAFLLPVKSRKLLTVSSAPLGSGPWLSVGKEGGPFPSSQVALILGDADRGGQQEQQLLLQRNGSSSSGGVGSFNAAAIVSSSFTGRDGGGLGKQKSGGGGFSNSAEERDKCAEETFVLKDVFKKMWADQGDSISLQYTGTGSVFSSQIKQGGKSSFSSNLDHAIKAIGRFYHNTFEDAFRQECVDLLVGEHRLCQQHSSSSNSSKACAPDSASSRRGGKQRTPLSAKQMSKHSSSSSKESSPSSVPLRIWVGSWNVAGRDLHEWDNLEDWLTPTNEQADVFVFCVQELVELTGFRVLMSLKDKDKETRLEVKAAAGLQGLAWAVPPPSYAEERRQILDMSEALLSRKSSVCSGDLSAWSTGAPVAVDQGSRAAAPPAEFEDSIVDEEWTQLDTPYQQQQRQQCALRNADSSSSSSLHIPSYVKVHSVSMVGLWICIFVRAELRRLINNVEATTVKVGMKGNAGNKGWCFCKGLEVRICASVKGAVGVRFSLGRASFCFLNVHLASGQTSGQERLQQMQLVLQQAFQTGLTNYPTVLRHDFSFIAGDFNFRLHASHQQVVEELNGADLTSLLLCDQLYICKKHRVLPFASLREPPITFRPTYKYKRNSQFYDLKRTPAWCDRVLFGGFLVPPASSPTDCNTPDCPVQCVSYTHHQRYFSSDHKPISGVFDVFIPFNKLQAESSVRSRESWHRVGADNTSHGGGGSSRVFSHFASPLASAGDVASSYEAERGVANDPADISLGSDNWTPNTAPHEQQQQQLPPLQTLEGASDLLGGEVVDDPLLSRLRRPLPAHPEEANLLSLPGSPRQGEISNFANPSLLPSARLSREGRDDGQASHTNAMDELDFLFSKPIVQQSATNSPVTRPSSFFLGSEQQQQPLQLDPSQQQPQRGPTDFSDFPDLLS